MRKGGAAELQPRILVEPAATSHSQSQMLVKGEKRGKWRRPESFTGRKHPTTFQSTLDHNSLPSRQSRERPPPRPLPPRLSGTPPRPSPPRCFSPDYEELKERRRRSSCGDEPQIEDPLPPRPPPPLSYTSTLPPPVPKKLSR